VEPGLTEIEDVVVPLLHKYVGEPPADETLRFAVPPGHKESPVNTKDEVILLVTVIYLEMVSSQVVPVLKTVTE
jgi:hypothetical protein